MQSRDLWEREWKESETYGYMMKEAHDVKQHKQIIALTQTHTCTCAVQELFPKFHIQNNYTD